MNIRFKIDLRSDKSSFTNISNLTDFKMFVKAPTGKFVNLTGENEGLERFRESTSVP